MRRGLGIAAGVLVHAAFGVMVWYLYWFLKGDAATQPPRPWLAVVTPYRFQTFHGGEMFGALGLDFLLALQFVVVHSVLLHPAVRERLAERIGAAFYGLFFCAATTAGLALTMACWRTSPDVWWRFSGPARIAIDAAFYGSWVLLFYTFFLNGIGYQTGWTPWWDWVCRRPIPARPFKPRGIFRFMRHPSYLAFLGLVWFAPVMSADRAVLTAVWTIYIFVGSYLKDRRLLHYIGEPYRRYEAAVPGYPGIFWGPLGRVRVAAGRRAVAVVGGAAGEEFACTLPESGQASDDRE